MACLFFQNIMCLIHLRDNFPIFGNATSRCCVPSPANALQCWLCILNTDIGFQQASPPLISLKDPDSQVEVIDATSLYKYEFTLSCSSPNLSFPPLVFHTSTIHSSPLHFLHLFIDPFRLNPQVSKPVSNPSCLHQLASFPTPFILTFTSTSLHLLLHLHLHFQPPPLPTATFFHSNFTSPQPSTSLSSAGNIFHQTKIPPLHHGRRIHLQRRL